MNDDNDFPGDRPFPSETKEITTTEIRPSAVVPATPMELLVTAIDRGMPPETIEKLMGLQERWEANQAKKAFDAAIASAKAEIPPILKTAQGHNHKYEDLASIAKVVDPILSKYGLSYRFRIAQDNGSIKVICVLSHAAGHCEENPLSNPPDKGPGRNDIQAVGSTLTYLQRYTLKAALGLAAAKDDDGKASDGAEFITQRQVDDLTTLIVDTGGDVKKFCEFCKVETIANIYANKYEAAVKAVNQAAAQRKQAPKGQKYEAVVDPEKQETQLADGWPGPISKDQAERIRTLIVSTKSDAKKFCTFMGVDSVDAIPEKDFDRAIKALEKKKGGKK